MNDISASPLSWPPGKPRTPASDRKQGRLGVRRLLHDAYPATANT
ncbi:hypothetical protein ACT3OH_01750 [Vreelandella zhanjiangensis]